MRVDHYFKYLDEVTTFCESNPIKYVLNLTTAKFGKSWVLRYLKRAVCQKGHDWWTVLCSVSVQNLMNNPCIKGTLFKKKMCNKIKCIFLFIFCMISGT